MVCIPEQLKLLLSNRHSGRCIHQEHDEQHDVASAAAPDGVMDLPGLQLQLRQLVLDIEEVCVMRIGVDERKQQHGVRQPLVEVDVVIERHDCVEIARPQRRDDVAAHGEQQCSTVYTQNKTSPSGHIDTSPQLIQQSEFFIILLLIITIDEHSDMDGPEH